MVAQAVVIICNILALCNPGDKLISILGYLGLSMLIVGSISVVVFVKKRATLHDLQWLLSDGISAVLLSLFVLFNEIILKAVIPFFFGEWKICIHPVLLISLWFVIWNIEKLNCRIVLISKRKK